MSPDDRELLRIRSAAEHNDLKSRPSGAATTISACARSAGVSSYRFARFIDITSVEARASVAKCDHEQIKTASTALRSRKAVCHGMAGTLTLLVQPVSLQYIR